MTTTTRRRMLKDCGQMSPCCELRHCVKKRRMEVEGTTSGEVGVLMDDNDYKAKDNIGVSGDTTEAAWLWTEESEKFLCVKIRDKMTTFKLVDAESQSSNFIWHVHVQIRS